MEEKTFFNGDWKAIEKVGQGTFGVVYKAVKEQYGIKSYSAIKQILIPYEEKEYSRMRSEGMTKSDIEKSFDRQVEEEIKEIDFLNQFKDNENIVSIEDFEVLKRKDKDGRIINIKMELLQNLDEYVLEKNITDKDILKMALDILNALEDCEEKNVFHRDIKPDNVLVNTKGVYKLSDFGEAKTIEKTVSDMSRRGTDNYMTPELNKGERGSKSVDTYSLGIMLYKYFNNNRLPYLPDYPNEITYKDREEAFSNRMSGKTLKAPVKASYNIAKIILKACSYKPEDRYESAMEFRNDVEKEYRSIISPIKLFDFQNTEEEKTDYDKTEGIFQNISDIKTNHDKTTGIFGSEEYKTKETKLEHDSTSGIFQDLSSETEEKSRYDKTSGIFSETSNKKDKYDKTVGIFENDKPIDININEEIDEKNIEQKEQFKFKKEKAEQRDETEEICTESKQEPKSNINKKLNSQYESSQKIGLNLQNILSNKKILIAIACIITIILVGSIIGVIINKDKVNIENNIAEQEEPYK